MPQEATEGIQESLSGLTALANVAHEMLFSTQRRSLLVLERNTELVDPYFKVLSTGFASMIVMSWKLYLDCPAYVWLVKMEVYLNYLWRSADIRYWI